MTDSPMIGLYLFNAVDGYDHRRADAGLLFVPVLERVPIQFLLHLVD